MGARASSKDHLDSPGPGAYSTLNTLGKAPAFSIAGRKESKDPSEVPGKNNYLKKT